jgi:hypothetical protein
MDVAISWYSLHQKQVIGCLFQNDALLQENARADGE